MRIKEVGYGDEIITPSLTAYPTVVAIQKCGAKPVFADIDPSTALIDLESVKRCLSKIFDKHLLTDSRSIKAVEGSMSAKTGLAPHF